MITLTNGVQIPENAVQLQTTAAIDGYYVTQPLRLVQYDETLPVAAVQLTYQNQPYTPPTGAELNVRMGKPDGTTVYNPCLGMDSSGIVYFAFTQQMTIVAGTGTLTVEITDSGVKNSAPIIAEIRPNPVPEGSIESTDEFLTLQEIFAEAEKWGQIVQANASNIQQVVDNLDDIQNAAENAQAAAASAAAAQQAAQEALGFRTFFSAVRPDANGNLDPSRPMVVGPAASVQIESKGDRIQSVTAFGFTQQAGTGDPSPSNVRAITNGGMQANLFPGFTQLASRNLETGELQPNSNGNVSSDLFSCKANQDYYVSMKRDVISSLRVWFWDSSETFIQSTSIALGAANPAGTFKSPTNAAKMAVSAFSAGGNLENYTEQLVVYGTTAVPYTPYAGAEYGTVIQIQSGEYRATCLPLTAPLCEGDSVVSWAKSGCDKTLVLDGTQSLTWNSSGESPYGGWFSVSASDVPAPVSGVVPQILSDQLFAVRSVAQLFVSGIVSNASGSKIVFTLFGQKSVEDANAYLSQNPITIRYRSTNYTEAADIAVSLETHQRAVLVLDESTRFVTDPAGSGNGLCYCNLLQSPKAYSKYQAERFVQKDSTAAGGAYLSGALKINPTGGQFADLGATVDDAATKLNEYFTANPTKIVYQLATPITYAHEAVVLEAATGDQLTYTVTGQSGGQVSVALKPFQDGGHAATADNSQQLDGLTLSALQNLLVPVGYIFSWAPTSGGPDLSTASKVAAYFGFGTWEAYGTGQVLVGVDAGQTEFATVGKTGGEKTHTLIANEVPPQNVSAKISGVTGTVMVDSGVSSSDFGCTFNSDSGFKAKPATTIQTEGGGQPHNNLQPYVVVYRWQRVA